MQAFFFSLLFYETLLFTCNLYQNFSLGKCNPPLPVLNLIQLLPTRYQYLGFALNQQPTPSPESLDFPKTQKQKLRDPSKAKEMTLDQRQRSRGNPSRHSRPCLGEYLIHKPEPTKWATLALSWSQLMKRAPSGNRSKRGKDSLSPLHVLGPPWSKRQAVSQPCVVQNRLVNSGTTSRRPGPWPPRCCHAAAGTPG